MPGDLVTIDRWSFAVTAVRRRAITEVVISSFVPAEPDAASLADA